MARRKLLYKAILLFSCCSSLATAKQGEYKGPSSKIAEFCAWILSPRAVLTSPLSTSQRADDISQKTLRILEILRTFRVKDQENLLRLIYADGTAMEGKEQLFSHLLESLGHGEERDFLRIIHRELPKEIASALKSRPLVRDMMRTLGSTDPDYLTPAFLITEIGELYSNLKSEEQRITALADLFGKLPLWGFEALKGALVKLGRLPVEAEALLNERIIDHRKSRFFVREGGHFRLRVTSEPDYFADYRKVPDVRKFLDYFKKRSRESVTVMRPLKDESLLSEQRVEPVISVFQEEPKAPPIPNIQERPPEPINWKFTQDFAIAGRRRLNEVRQQTPKILPETKLETRQLPGPTAIASAHRFSQFFFEIGKANLERKVLIDVLRCALIEKGNVLIVGSSGTAKTQVAEQTLAGIRADEPSYKKLSIHQETTADDILGPVSMREAMRNDRYVRNEAEALSQVKYVVLDEIDKARPRFFPALYNLLNRRGPDAQRINTEVVIGTSNKYISQLYSTSNLPAEEIQPFVDRFDHVVFIPGEIEEMANALRLQLLADGPPSTLSQSDIENVRSLLDLVQVPIAIQIAIPILFHRLRHEFQTFEGLSEDQVRSEIAKGVRVAAPYKSTRIFSPRSLTKALTTMIRTQTVLRWIKNSGQSSLVSDFTDLKGLRSFLAMNGPVGKSRARLAGGAVSPDEKAQYRYLKFESEGFDVVANDLENEVNGTSPNHPNSLLVQIISSIENGSLTQAKLKEQLDRGHFIIQEILDQWLQFPSEIGEIKGIHLFFLIHRADALATIEKFLNLSERLTPH